MDIVFAYVVLNGYVKHGYSHIQEDPTKPYTMLTFISMSIQKWRNVKNQMAFVSKIAFTVQL